MVDWHVTVDVLCVGSGAGGLSAAITAAEAGAKVLVVEKDDKAGGVTGISSGQCWVGNNSLAEAANIPDSREATLAYLQHLSQGLADLTLQAQFVDDSVTTIDYLCQNIGIPFRVVKDYPDYYYPAVTGAKASGRYLEVAPVAASILGDWADKCIVTSYGEGYAYTTSQEWVDHQQGFLSGDAKPIWECLAEHMSKDERCAGAGLAVHLLKACLDRQVDIWLQSPAVRLIVENNQLLGAVVATPEGDRNVRAKSGVLLATSGYDWNQAFVERFEVLPNAGSMSPPTVEGDHLVMAAQLAAIPQPSRAPAQTPVFIGYRVPGEQVYNKPSYRMLIPGAPHSIIVNAEGQRFANDSFYPDVATKVARFDGQEQGMPNWPAWLVFDQQMLNKYGLLPFYPGDTLAEGMAIVADNLEDLASKAGICEQGLQATIEHFNAQCVTGKDDFGRGTVPWGALMAGDPSNPQNPNMAAISEGPFYAIQLERVVMGVPTAGLKVNSQAQVLNVSDQVIAGLYAAGNSTSWLEIGGGYNSGIANTRGLVQGHNAAKHMLAASH